MSVMQLTDEEIDPEISFSQVCSLFLMPNDDTIFTQLMTGPPRNASGRVIRSGSRRLKSHQTGGVHHPVMPAYGEQVARFMQVTSFGLLDVCHTCLVSLYRTPFLRHCAYQPSSPQTGI